jgi:hypothetical protein
MALTIMNRRGFAGLSAWAQAQRSDEPAERARYEQVDRCL